MVTQGVAELAQVALAVRAQAVTLIVLVAMAVMARRMAQQVAGLVADRCLVAQPGAGAPAGTRCQSVGVARPVIC